MRQDLASTAEIEAILSVSDVHVRFGGLKVLTGVTFDVRRGSLTAMIGPNGAGKTTAFDVITGFRSPDRGSVKFDGRTIDNATPHTIARGGLVRTFQTTKTLRRLTVLENMMLAAPGNPGERIWPVYFRSGAVRLAESRARDRALELLNHFRLDHLSQSLAGVLSGGQRKLLELARALMLDPRLVLLDEPIAGVNPVLGRDLLAHVVHLRDDRGITVLFIEHDMNAVMSFAEDVVVLAQGAVLARGTPEEVRGDQRVIDAYLGPGASHGVHLVRTPGPAEAEDSAGRQ